MDYHGGGFEAAAAVDVARLAGLTPSGVICEIMRDDGSMARLDDLMEFARVHGLKIGTIRDLIAYRLKKDHMVERVAETRFVSRSGAAWTAQVFRDKAGGEEQLALVHGAIDPASPALRGYGIGAQILAALGIHDMILLSNTRHAPVGLSAYGLAIVEERCIEQAA